MLKNNINEDLLLTLDNPELLFEFLKVNYNSNLINKNILFRSLYNLSEHDSSKALVIINLLNEKFNDISFLAIKIKILSSEKMITKAIDILKNISENKLKKRLLIPIFTALCDINYEKAFNFLIQEIYQKFRLYENDLLCIYNKIKNHDFDKFMELLSNNEILIKDIPNLKEIKNLQNLKVVNLDSDNKCSNCKQKLIKFIFDSKKRQDLIINLEKEYLKNKKILMEPLQKKIDKNKYNVFIDGNNVLFSIQRSVNLNSYKRLETIYLESSKFGNVLITLHQRHKDYINKNLIINQAKYAKVILNRLEKNIFYTPYKMNDDWFFIWAGINTHNSFVITNDLLRDHIKNISEENIISNTLSRWINDYVVRYEFSSISKVKLNFPCEISKKIQKSNNLWHLPTLNDKWICQNLISN